MNGSKDSLFLTRHHWDALPPRRVVPLQVPVGNVVNLWAMSEPCTTPEQCKLVMQEMQKMHMEQNMSDIQSNFYIGGDGNIYEGRGWYNSPPKYVEENNEFATKLNGQCIEICYIGYPTKEPNHKQLNASADLLTAGTVEKFLKKRLDVYISDPKKMTFVKTYYSDSRDSFLPGDIHK